MQYWNRYTFFRATFEDKIWTVFEIEFNSWEYFSITWTTSERSAWQVWRSIVPKNEVQEKLKNLWDLIDLRSFDKFNYFIEDIKAKWETYWSSRFEKIIDLENINKFREDFEQLIIDEFSSLKEDLRKENKRWVNVKIDALLEAFWDEIDKEIKPFNEGEDNEEFKVWIEQYRVLTKREVIHEIREMCSDEDEDFYFKSMKEMAECEEFYKVDTRDGTLEVSHRYKVDSEARISLFGASEERIVEVSWKKYYVYKLEI